MVMPILIPDDIRAGFEALGYRSNVFLAPPPVEFEYAPVDGLISPCEPGHPHDIIMLVQLDDSDMELLAINGRRIFVVMKGLMVPLDDVSSRS